MGLSFINSSQATINDIKTKVLHSSLCRLTLCCRLLYHRLGVLTNIIALVIVFAFFVSATTTVQSNFSSYCTNDEFLTKFDPNFTSYPYNPNATYYDNPRRILCLSVGLGTPAMVFMGILILTHVIITFLTYDYRRGIQSCTYCSNLPTEQCVDIEEEVCKGESQWSSHKITQLRFAYWIANATIIIGAGALVMLVYLSLSAGYVYNPSTFCTDILGFDSSVVECDLSLVPWLIWSILSIFIICFSYSSRHSWRWMSLHQARDHREIEIEILSDKASKDGTLDVPKSTCAALGIRSTILDLFKGITNIMMTLSHCGAFFLAYGGRDAESLSKHPGLNGFLKFSFVSGDLDFSMFISSFAYMLYIAYFDNKKTWKFVNVGRTVAIIDAGYCMSSMAFFYVFDRWTPAGIDKAASTDFYSIPNLPLKIASFQHMGGWSEFLAALALMYAIWYPLRYVVCWCVSRCWAWMSLCLGLLLLNIIKLNYSEGQIWPAIFLNQYFVPSFPAFPFSYVFLFGMVISHHDGFVRNINTKFPWSLVIVCWISVVGFFLTCMCLTPLGPLTTILPQTYSRFGPTAPNYLIGQMFCVMCIAVACSLVEWSRFQTILRYKDMVGTLPSWKRFLIQVVIFPVEFTRECLLHFGRNTLVYLILTNLVHFTLSPMSHPDDGMWDDVNSVLLLWMTELFCIRFILYVVQLNFTRTVERRQQTILLITSTAKAMSVECNNGDIPRDTNGKDKEIVIASPTLSFGDNNSDNFPLRPTISELIIDIPESHDVEYDNHDLDPCAEVCLQHVASHSYNIPPVVETQAIANNIYRGPPNDEN